jgi:ribosomal-protein-alanine N-acetyltransferase
MLSIILKGMRYLNSNQFRVRKAKLKDIEAIMNIENESFAAGIRENKEVMLERITTFNDGFLVLVDKEDMPLAYISSELWDYKKDINKTEFTLGHSIVDKHKKDGQELYISSTALAQSLRGYGYGHILFEHLLNMIKRDYPNLKSSILLVSKKWSNAQKIYQNNGFIQVDCIKDFFVTTDDINDGIIMRKKL